MAVSNTVFLFDVDNTLLDNDAVQEDLSAHLQREFGSDSRDRYWAIFEELRAELGYADYLGALQRYRLENLDEPQLSCGSPRSWSTTRSRSACTRARWRRSPTASARAHGHPLRRRRGVSAAQGAALGTVACGGGAGAHLPAQGADARRRRAALPGAALRDGGRQAAHTHGHEEPVGRRGSRPSSCARATTRSTRQDWARIRPRTLTLEKIGELRLLPQLPRSGIGETFDMSRTVRGSTGLHESSAALQGVLGALLEAERQLAPPASPLERLQQITSARSGPGCSRCTV